MRFSYSQFVFSAAALLFTGTQLDARSVIVDDSDTSRITYSLTWNVGNNCSICIARLDATQTFDGTWHDVSTTPEFKPFFTFHFTGTYIEARYISVDMIGIDVTTTSVAYSLDGALRGTFTRPSTNSSVYFYNQMLFGIGGLTNSEHTLRVDMLGTSLLLLDYLVYDDGSVETSSTASSTSSVSSSANDPRSTSDQITTSAPSGPGPNIAVIVSAVVAVVIVIGVVVVVSIIVSGVVAVSYLKQPRRERGRRSIQPSASLTTSALSPKPSVAPTLIRPPTISPIPLAPSPYRPREYVFEVSPPRPLARRSISTIATEGRASAQIPNEPVEEGLIDANVVDEFPSAS